MQKVLVNLKTGKLREKKSNEFTKDIVILFQSPIRTLNESNKIKVLQKAEIILKLVENQIWID